LSDVQDWYDYTYEIARCKRGFSGETLVIVKGALRGTIIPKRGKPMTKHKIQTRVDLCKGM
jgi:hypothetical protein